MIKTSVLAQVVKDLAMEFPDKVSGSMYFEGGQPCCIVGHGLDRLGLSSFGDQADLNRFTSVEGLMGHTPLVDDDSGKSLMFLEIIQVVQDRGAPWGSALNRALEVLQNPDGESFD